MGPCGLVISKQDSATANLDQLAPVNKHPGLGSELIAPRGRATKTMHGACDVVEPMTPCLDRLIAGRTGN